MIQDGDVSLFGWERPSHCQFRDRTDDRLVENKTGGGGCLGVSVG